MKHALSRKLLQDEDALGTTLTPTVTYSPDPLLQSVNGSSTVVVKRPFKPNTAFDSSMALTVLVLITALFFMGFFSFYIRRLADDADPGTGDDEARRRRQHPRQSSSSSGISDPPKGLDPSTVGSLPLIPYGGDPKHPIDCAICLSEFEERETVKMIPYCRHVFHRGCIDTWLSSHVSCPLCRSTQICVLDEVCLAVVQEDVDQGASEVERRSTVESESARLREAGTLGVRRACSTSNLRDGASLQRSMSF